LGGISQNAFWVLWHTCARASLQILRPRARLMLLQINNTMPSRGILSHLILKDFILWWAILYLRWLCLHLAYLAYYLSLLYFVNEKWLSCKFSRLRSWCCLCLYLSQTKNIISGGIQLASTIRLLCLNFYHRITSKHGIFKITM